MDIQVNFAMPEKITESLMDPDSIKVKFKIGQLFVDKKDFNHIETNLTILH